MGLILPSGPDWAYCSHNIGGTPDPTNIGTSVAAGTSNADGTAVTLLGALAHDVEYLRLSLSQSFSQSTNNNALLSILIDPAGGTSWQPLIPYLIAGGLMGTSAVSSTSCHAFSGFYDFPIWIRAGASIGAVARCAASSAAPTIRVVAQAFGGNAHPASWWCGQRVSAIGTVEASSRGATHTPGDSGSFSSWTDFGSPLGARCGALAWGVGPKADSTLWTNLLYQMEFGVGGQRIGAPFMRAVAAGENGARLGGQIVWAGGERQDRSSSVWRSARNCRSAAPAAALPKRSVSPLMRSTEHRPPSHQGVET